MSLATSWMVTKSFFPMPTIEADDYLDALIAEQLVDDQERDLLVLEARRFLFDADECPTISIEWTLGRLWNVWLDGCDRVDRWQARYANTLRDLGDELRALPKGAGARERQRPIRDAIEDAKWRQGVARHVLYQEFPYAQQQMLAFFEDAWRESGVDAFDLDDRMQELGCIITNHRSLEWASEKPLLEIAALVATHL